MAILTGNILIDIVGVLIAIFAVIYVNFMWTYQTWKRKNIPFLKPRFPYGNMQMLFQDISPGDDVFNIVKEAKKQGWKFFGMFLISHPFFVPLDLDLVKHILTKDFNHFVDRGGYVNERDDPLSAHLFALGGTKWKNLRAKISPTFTSGKLKGMFQTLVDCSLLLEKYIKDHDNKEPIEIKNVLTCYTVDVIGSCAFGLKCNSFQETDSPFLRYGKKVFNIGSLQQVITMFTITFPNISKMLHLKTLPTDVAKFYFDVVSKTVDYRVKNNSTRKDFLQLLIDIKDDNAGHTGENTGDSTALTLEEVAAQCFVFFLAGYETSSTTMTFALFELSRHPEIQERVREELFRVLKKYDNKICYDSIKELEYMQQVIDETLRKYPPLPFINRECVEDYNIPGTDITLDKGTGVLIPISSFHYDEEIFENPMEFDPDRFSHENKQKRHPYAHIPFGEGPRICVGMRFGLMQSKIGLVTILRDYRVTLSSKTKTPLKMDPKSFFPSVKEGIWLNLERIKH